MKLKTDILSRLEFIADSHITFLKPMTPQHLFAFGLPERDKTIRDMPADFELGWSGLQVLCSDEKTTDFLKSRDQSMFAFEGAGYVSLSSSMFDDWDKDAVGKIPDSDKHDITGFVTAIVGQSIQPRPDSNAVIVVHMIASDMGFPENVTGFQIHVVIPVEEADWLGMYQIKAQEMQAATGFYQHLKGIESPEQEIASNFSSSRTLN